jgi:hypothetical protein
LLRRRRRGEKGEKGEKGERVGLAWELRVIERLNFRREHGMALAKLVSIAVVLWSLTLGLEPIGAQAVRQDPAATTALSVDGGLKTLAIMIAQPAPTGLDARQQREYTAHTDWLRNVYARLEVYGTEVVSPRDAGSGMPTGKRQHKPMDVVRVEMEAIHKAIARESTQFDMLTGMLKRRHDLAMNAIRNMK